MEMIQNALEHRDQVSMTMAKQKFKMFFQII